MSKTQKSQKSQKSLKTQKTQRNQKKKQPGETRNTGGGFIFFVPDQGEGAAKAIVIALKVIMLIITSICALCFGILGPVCIWVGEYDPEVVENPAILTWLISSCVYIIGTFVIMLGHSRIASVIDIIAAAGSLVTYYLFVSHSADPDISVGPTMLYMPCLALTVLAVVIAMLINIPKWLEKQAQKANEKAPSIIDDDR